MELNSQMCRSVQSLSCIWLFATPWTAALQASLSITNSKSLLKLMSIESVMPSNHLILRRPLLLLPSVFPSIRVFSSESVLSIRKPAGASVQHQSFQWKDIQIIQFSHSVVSDSLWPRGLQHARLPCPSPTLGTYSIKLMSIESVMPSNHFILCRPLLLLPSVFPGIRVFSNASVLRIRSPKDWSFSFNISPFNEYSGLNSFRMYWLDLLAVQGTFKSLLQHHSSKSSVLWHSAFFMVQLSHPCMITGKT